MFERFTDRARRAVVLAQEEARLLNHNYIGTEHLLLGLIHEGEGLAARALESTGVTLDRARGRVEDRIGRGASTPKGHIPFTPRAKKSLELGLRESVRLGHNYIGTEHILLGLLREGEGVACVVLSELGADTLTLESTLGMLMVGYAAQAAGGETVQAASPTPPLQPLPPELRALDERVAELRNQKNDAIERTDWQEATRLREEEKLLTTERAQKERVWRMAHPGGVEPAAQRPAAEPNTETGPHCAHCRRPLTQTAAYSIVQVAEQDGDGKAPVLFVFCRTCGVTIDTLIVPDES